MAARGDVSLARKTCLAHAGAQILIDDLYYLWLPGKTYT